MLHFRRRNRVAFVFEFAFVTASSPQYQRMDETPADSPVGAL